MSYGIRLKSPKFQNIPQFTRVPGYSVDVPWAYLKNHLAREQEAAQEGGGIDLNPDFQRGHVWTPEKQTAFVEFILRGGESAKNLYFNCPNFRSGNTKGYVLVDGKQRLTAALAFLDDQVPVFGGWVYSDFTDKMDFLTARFRWNVNDLHTRAEVLQWYLDLNTGGVVHTNEEIEKVRALLAQELGTK